MTEPADTDLDETRRLLYMALVANRTKKYNLVGTLANALLHHQHIDTPRDEVLDRLIRIIDTGGYVVDDQEWLNAQIARCS